MAVELGISKSNAHRILRTLTSLGFAACPVAGCYEATLKTWEIGAAVLDRSDVKSVGRSVMVDLSARTGETVHLSLLDGTDVVYIDKVESNQPVRAYSRIGGRAPAHAVATGKVLLAFHAGDLKALLPKKLDSFTRLTLVKLEDMLVAIEEIRRRGYAVNKGEWREDVCGIAAPVRNNHNQVVAALGISGPKSRLTADRIGKLAAEVIAGANDISSRLGHVGGMRSVATKASASVSTSGAKRSATKTATTQSRRT